VDLRGLSGGGRSRAKPVSADRGRSGIRKKHTASTFLAVFWASERALCGWKRSLFKVLTRICFNLKREVAVNEHRSIGRRAVVKRWVMHGDHHCLISLRYPRLARKECRASLRATEVFRLR